MGVMWRTREGDVIPIRSMSQQHLRNSTRLKGRMLVNNFLMLLCLVGENIRRFFGGKIEGFTSLTDLPELEALDEQDTF